MTDRNAVATPGANHATPRVVPLSVRREFLAVARGRRTAMPGLVLQARRWGGVERRRAAQQGAAWRLGLTASKKVGNAVIRNRARRRLRALGREMLWARAAPQHDYVLIARAGTAARPWLDLQRDLETALRRLGLARGTDSESAGAGSGGKGSPR